MFVPFVMMGGIWSFVMAFALGNSTAIMRVWEQRRTNAPLYTFRLIIRANGFVEIVITGGLCATSAAGSKIQTALARYLSL